MIVSVRKIEPNVKLLDLNHICLDYAHTWDCIHTLHSKACLQAKVWDYFSHVY